MPELLTNGVNLHYEWQGNPAGPVLVFINGLLTDLTSWRAHLPYFLESYHCLTYDCRGQGLSDKPDAGPYTPRLHAQDLAGLLDELGVQKAILLGVSAGGCTALQYAARHPERVAALVLANVYGRADVSIRAKLNSWDSAMMTGGGPLRFDVSSPWIWGASYLNANFEGLKPWREMGTALDLQAAHHLIQGAMDHDVLEESASIACPTLLMAGDEDVLTPVSYAHALQRRMPGSRIVVLENAGHCMFLERPVRFCEIADEFLKQLPRGG